MLTITVPGGESFDNDTQKFVYTTDVTITLEHSLVSLSKWEALLEKPFLGREKKTIEETFAYIQAMCLTPDVEPEVFYRLTKENLDEVNNYIGAKMSATWFTDNKNQRPSREIITSELIYYWMTALNIPLECEHWHLNRLFTLIKVAGEKNSPKKKMGRSEALAQQRALNAQRQAEYGTAG